ncbi:MAG: phenylalanine--tRNA ligase subunit alpha, partial [Negativicutes bacterium]|nr:phenylalanine--tRNA ligase subunit alpha [Negativicutes bacterium]
MQSKINEIVIKAKEQIAQTVDLKELQNFRVEFLGKKGELTLILRTLGGLPAEERPKVGEWINSAKEEVTMLLDQKQEQLKSDEIQKKLSTETIDVTLPGT